MQQRRRAPVGGEQDELVIRTLHRVLQGTFDIEFLVESRTLARRLADRALSEDPDVLLIDDVVIIHHEPRPDGSRQMPEVGIVIPVHASALGKAMLAFLPEDEKRVAAVSAGAVIKHANRR